MNLTEVNEEDFCTQSSNFSCFETASLTAVDVLMYSAAAAVVLLTVYGNLLVIISICHFKQLHTPTNLLLLSLAVADLLVGITVMPFYFIYAIQSRWCFGAVCCTIFNVNSVFLSCVSIYNVAFIAVDRYFALHNPFLYSTKMTVNSTLIIISLLWLYSLIYNLILVYFNGLIAPRTEHPMCAEHCAFAINGIWLVVDLFIVFVAPFMTIIIMYLKIFVIAKRHANNIRCVQEQHHSKGTKKINYSLASETKAAKTVGILVSAFLLCLVPYYLTVIIFMGTREPSVFFTATDLTTLVFINSSINPIIYALFYSWFQKCFKLILTLRICKPGSSLITVILKDR
ncbi:trace amine-associated receptor 13c-like [Megalops cyprinoides]|uniref:trace amine-associated receptor 13c-like n=1 Tax=Megalops cyprinoides TaxID=118141 RepID=UPI001864E4BC|nr:trace amine-associated receptor 13c-like [Megalops cyprinoides]